ncbi:MAG: hypothetical protein ACK5CE_21230 [Actinomycetes bacterium]
MARCDEGIDVDVDDRDVRVREIVATGELECDRAEQSRREVGRTRDGQGAEGFEVDEELAAFALADGDQCGDARREFIGWYGTLRVKVQAPRPSAVGGSP